MTERPPAALAAVLLVVGLTGCSGGAGSSDRQAGADASPSTTTTAASPATVELASGPEIHLPAAADFRLPAGPDWDITDNGSPLVLANAPVEGALANVRIDASEFAQIGDDLAYAAKISAKVQASRYHARLHVAGYRDLGGVRGFVLEGRSKALGFNYYEWSGLDADNALVTVTFMIPVELELEDYVEPVLASLAWRR